MKITIISLLLLTTLIFSNAQDCNNPLIEVLNISQFALSSPQIISGASYCPSLQDGTNRSCCTSGFLNSIQSRHDAILAKLQSFAGTRDVTMRDNKGLISKLQQGLQDLQTLLQGVDNQTLASLIAADITTITQFVSNLTSSSDSLVAQFKDYQLKRATCFAKMLDIQASAFCLACDANYLSLGVNNDSLINMGNDTCNAIIDACYPYLMAATSQNNFIAIKPILDILKGYANITADLSGQERPDERPEGQKEFKKKNKTSPGQGKRFLESKYEQKKKEREAEEKKKEKEKEKFYQPPPGDYSEAKNKSKRGIPVPMRTLKLKDEEGQIKIPAGCEDPNNKYNCTWLCDQAFRDGQVQVNLLGPGGDKKSEEEDTPEADESHQEDTNENHEDDDNENQQRRLEATTSWSPKAGESGVTTVVTADPSGVTLDAGYLGLRVIMLLVVVAFYALI